CIDGFCCNDECAGQCQACDIPSFEGLCTTVGINGSAGPPHGDRLKCAGDQECGGVCDGSLSDACTYPEIRTPCGEPKCEDGFATRHVCNGLYYCVELPESACGAFRCDSQTDACKTSCASDGDCTEDGL